MFGTIAKGWHTGDSPIETQTPEQRQAEVDYWRKGWGTPLDIEGWAPSMAHDEQFLHWWANFLRLSAGPTTIINLMRLYSQIDISPILPTVRVPTLVLHRTSDRGVGVEQGRFLAQHIPGAKFVELPGEDHLWWVGDTQAVVAEIAEFLTGERQPIEPDRVLATVLFTDIVDSTRRLAEIGDVKWRDLLDRRNAVLHGAVDRFRGRVVKNTGDGCLVSLDGPARAIRCALAVGDEVRRLGIEIRAGLHTGEIDLVGDEVGGLAVHIAQRIMAKAGASEKNGAYSASNGDRLHTAWPSP